MKIRYNEDAEVVARLRAALLKRDLQCPCRLQKIEDNDCMCKEFRDQIADPELARRRNEGARAKFAFYGACFLMWSRPKRCFFIPSSAAYPAG